MKRFEGRVVVVTGGGSGIGLATARRFHDEGASVAIAGRREDVLATASESIGGAVLTVPADVSKSQDLQSLYTRVTERFGPIDVLVVNAGLKRFVPFEQTSEDDFREIFAVNTAAAFFTIQRAIPHLNHEASIVLTGLAPVNPAWRRPGTAAYSASKDALRSLTRTLASELADRGVRVNAVNPGTIATDSQYLPKDAMAERLTRIADAVPMKRLGRPEEVAGVVAFLASADASYVTGEAINIDGGMG
jgi:NAD(P)-dependent dehydrogenase (short-subunit alcohol dehydrogenase family)